MSTKTTKNMNPARLAKEFHLGSNPFEEEEDYLQRRVSTLREFDEIWHGIGKLERYCLSSIILNRVMDRLFQSKLKRAPFGLIMCNDPGRSGLEILVVSDIPDENPFDKFNSFWEDTLRYELLQEEQYLRSLPQDHILARRYRRLEEFADFYGRHSYLVDSGPRQALDELWWGVSNVKWMSEVLKNIPILYTAKEGHIQNPFDMAQTAKNSYPLITELACMHFYDFFGFMKGASKWNSEGRSIYKLTYLNVSMRMDLDDDFRNNIPKPHFQEHGKTGSQIGCPFMIPIDADSPVKKMWDWYVDIANSVYKKLHSEGRL